jgi:hypothetical protein
MLHSVGSSAERTRAVLQDPAMSFWLKAALRSSAARDPIDAAKDATMLADILCACAQERIEDCINAGLVAPSPDQC